MNDPFIGSAGPASVVEGIAPVGHLENRASIKLELNVPEEPTVLEIATAFRRKIQAQHGQAEESVLDAELNVANAQRIALAARSKVATLAAQLATLDKQIELL